MNQCKDCKFWTGKKPGGATIQTGLCKRHAPRPYLRIIKGTTQICWPITEFNDWCGQFEPRKEEQEPAPQKQNRTEAVIQYTCPRPSCRFTADNKAFTEKPVTLSGVGIACEAIWIITCPQCRSFFSFPK